MSERPRKEELKAFGQVDKLKKGARGAYGIVLVNGEEFYLSQKSSVELEKTVPGSYVEISYGEFKDRKYINSVVAQPSPGEELAAEDDVFVKEEEAPAPEAVTPPAAERTLRVVKDLPEAAPEPEPEADAPAATDTTAISAPERKAIIRELSFNEKRDLIEHDKEEQSKYWTGKTLLDREVFNINREKFEFEKQRAADIAEQVRVKIRADLIPVASEIYARANPNSDGVPIGAQIEKIFTIAYHLANSTEVGFKAAVEDLRKASSQKQAQGQQQAAGGKAPGR